MNSLKLREQLYKLGRENSRLTWEQVEGIVAAILGVYMIRGRDYDAEQAIGSMERFNRTGVLTF